MSMAEIKVVQTKLSSIIKYLEPFLPLANCHMVGFFTENYWKKFISCEIQREYENIGLPGLYKILECASKTSTTHYEESELETKNPFLLQHLSAARSMCLNAESDICLSYSQFQEKLKYFGYLTTNDYSVDEFMSPKKLHEVEVMSHIVAAITGISGSSHIVDVGSGKGYLSSMLALQHGLRVVGVDSSQINSHGAVKRTEKLKKLWPGLCRRAVERSSHHSSAKRGKQWKSKSHGSYCTNELQDSDNSNDSSLEYARSVSTASLYKQTTLFISEDTNIEEIVQETFPNEVIYTMALVGLHTCGNLAATCLKLFAKNDSLKALCNVGCCYHLIEEEFSPNPFHSQITSEKSEFGFPMSEFLRSKKFAMGRNVRMLATQSIDRISDKNEIPIKALFYRALLQVILKEKTGEDRPDWNIGRGIAAKSKTFKDYCDKSFKKLNIDFDLSDSEILSFHDQYLERRNELEAFFLIRVCLAPVIETVLMLDRLLYLLELGIKEVNIVQMFDPVISPRCYGIIALKNVKYPERNN